MAVITSLLPETREAACIIPNRLYFIPLSHPPPDICLPPHTHLLCIDDSLHYEPFWDDFGPLNLACTYRFVRTLHHLLTADPRCVVYYHCNNQREAKSNAAVLVGIYRLLCCGASAAIAYEPLKVFEPYIPFRDASTGPHTFKLTPYHVIEAMAAAISAGCFTLDSFNVDEYEHFETVQHGDLNSIVPNRFIAFASPHPPPITAAQPTHLYTPFTPNDYLPIFRHYNVTSVVRLNKKTYDPKPFTQHGIGHFSLFFPDGSNPPIHLLLSFLALCDRHAGSGVMAVHCKAGLGRTGSLLGCWLMREWGWKATEAIGWLRLCRPGSVIGGQQEWMEEMQPRMWLEGDRKRARDGKSEERKEATADMMLHDDESQHDAKVEESATDGVGCAAPPRLRSYSSREEQANGLLARKAQRVRTTTTSAGATVRATAGVTVIGSRRGSASAKAVIVSSTTKGSTPPMHPNTARPRVKNEKDVHTGDNASVHPMVGGGSRSAQISPLHHTRSVGAAVTTKQLKSSKSSSTSPTERSRATSTTGSISVYRS